MPPLPDDSSATVAHLPNGAIGGRLEDSKSTLQERRTLRIAQQASTPMCANVFRKRDQSTAPDRVNKGPVHIPRRTIHVADHTAAPPELDHTNTPFQADCDAAASACEELTLRAKSRQSRRGMLMEKQAHRGGMFHRPQIQLHARRTFQIEFSIDNVQMRQSCVRTRLAPRRIQAR